MSELPEEPKTLGGEVDKQLSRLMFEARELISMFNDIVENQAGKADAWTRRVRDEIDEFRREHGWSANGFGGEGEPVEKPEPSIPEDRFWYLAICVQCSGGLREYLAGGEVPMAVPFGEEEKRDEWVHAHMDGTGHSIMLMNQERDPKPPKMPEGDDPRAGKLMGPHSRACGVRAHDHGTDCHENCPTCHGKFT
jgi:hypothetical protein